MEVVKIISEHRKIPKNKPVARGKRRVEAIVIEDGEKRTRHVDVSN